MSASSNPKRDASIFLLFLSLSLSSCGPLAQPFFVAIKSCLLVKIGFGSRNLSVFILLYFVEQFLTFDAFCLHNQTVIICTVLISSLFLPCHVCVFSFFFFFLIKLMQLENTQCELSCYTHNVSAVLLSGLLQMSVFVLVTFS